MSEKKFTPESAVKPTSASLPETIKIVESGDKLGIAIRKIIPLDATPEELQILDLILNN